LQTEPRFIFREQSVVHGLLTGVVDLIGNASEAWVKARLLKVVVHFVQQVAER
jgi:hypothetical protein